MKQGGCWELWFTVSMVGALATYLFWTSIFNTNYRFLRGLQTRLAEQEAVDEAEDLLKDRSSGLPHPQG